MKSPRWPKALVFVVAAVGACCFLNCSMGPGDETVIHIEKFLERTRLTGSGFEVSVLDPGQGFSRYQMTRYDEPLPWMSTSAAVAHGGSMSLTAPEKGTAIARAATLIDTGIVGIEFFIRADRKEQSNFILALGRAGSTGTGSYYYLGMGFDKSDSITYTCSVSGEYFIEGFPADSSVRIAPITLDRWYRCTIEYDSATSTAAFYLDLKKAGSMHLPNLSGFDQWLGLCDAQSAAGPKQYYADDVEVYAKP